MTFCRLVVLVLSGALLAACADDRLPSRPPVEKVVWLEQNWSAEQRQWFSHADQGTRTFFIPYEWLAALEQPGFKLFGEPGLILDGDYLAKLGFIPGEVSAFNKAGLPVGFAMDADALDPVTGEKSAGIGFTCAACHTGHMTYEGTSIRYSGGPAMISVDTLMIVLFRSMFETQYNQRQFERFAARVLGDNNTAEARAELQRHYSTMFMMMIEEVFAGISAQSEAIILADIESNRESSLLRDIADNIKNNLAPKEGFARTDALNRIGNQVFALDAGKPQNAVAITAPVSYPFIWSSSWFAWVQYDGSIMQPMIRNVGEGLGVGALLNTDGDSPDRFASTVRVENLFRIENQLAGPPPFAAREFAGLRAPQWPETLLGEIDQSKAHAGAELYQTHCQHCHLPPVGSAEFWSEKYWTVSNAAGVRLLDLPMIAVDDIGTDPNQANVLAKRTVDTTGMGLDTEVFAGDECKPMHISDGKKINYAFALGVVVQETANHWYAANDISPEQQQVMNGNLPNCLRAPVAYKARPLNGIWATAPYLHNGSVPNLYALLSPVDERPQQFYVGNLEFDPVKVGYQTGKKKGLFEFNTDKPGNSNAGHVFSDMSVKGVIGPGLNEQERSALVEFLKTL